MPHPLLKSILWVLSGIAWHLSTTPPGIASANDDIQNEGTLFNFLVSHGIPTIKGLAWCLTLVEVLTIHSSSFRFITSFLNSNIDSGTISTPFLASLTLLLASSFCRMCCYRAMGSLFTFELTIRPNHRLITAGPYQIVRHPSYTAMLGVALGMGLLHFVVRGSWAVECGLVPRGWTAFWLWGSSASILCLRLWSRTKREDQGLKKMFGEEWEVYKRRVPYRFIPGMW